MLPKSLVLDTNILFSFFKLESIRRNVFRELLKQDTEFSSPKQMLEELYANKEEIKKYASINESEFSYLSRLFTKQIELFVKDKYSQFLSQATQLSPHSKDTVYFALSLALNKCPIWSDEKAFKQQSEIAIFSTKDLLDVLS